MKHDNNGDLDELYDWLLNYIRKLGKYPTIATDTVLEDMIMKVNELRRRNGTRTRKAIQVT